jgi:hypothetical protein
MVTDSRAEYDRLRRELQALKAASIPGSSSNRVIRELEQIQHHIKKEKGPKGNNPRE